MGHSALSARGKLGAITRQFPNDPDRLAEARRNLAAAKLQDYIERTLADAPPLTDSQRDRLALLLRDPNAGGARSDRQPCAESSWTDGEPGEGAHGRREHSRHSAGSLF